MNEERPRVTVPWTPTISRYMPQGELPGAALRDLVDLVKRARLTPGQWLVASTAYIGAGIIVELGLHTAPA